jgi:carbon storage regulator
VLVLSRREGEKLIIGESIEIVVVRIDCDKVRLGVVADKSVSVRRDELKPLEVKR